MSSIRFALGQIRVEGGDLNGNLNRAEEAIAKAAAAAARVVVLPEAVDFGWMGPFAGTSVAPVPDGSVCRRLCEVAAANNVYVCSGLTEGSGEWVFNAAVLIDPAGRVLVKHRKINELEIAHSLYAKGDRLQVVDTEFGPAGVMICADGFARDCLLSRALGFMGAQIILSPCAWAVPPDFDHDRTPYGGLWLDCYGPVAREFGLWIVAVSNVGVLDAGPWAGRHCIGSSMVIGPDGSPVVRAPFGADAEALLFIDIPVAEPVTQAARWAGLYDHP